MNFSIVIHPAGWHFTATGDIPLLITASSAAIVLPSSCRNGTCRACLCHMESGQIRYTIPWPGLSTEEKQAGYILPCIAYPVTDIVLRVPAARRAEMPSR